MLDAEYITACEQRARRFSGAYTGTSGTLAADVMRLLKERGELMQSLEESNAALRAAVADRMANTPDDDPKKQGYSPLAGCKPAEECAAKVLTDAWREPENETIPSDWILRGERELKAERLRGDSIVNAKADDLRPGSHEFLAVLDELKELHLKKTLDYGVDEDALSNIRSSADIVNMPAWAGCVLRMMDKMHRLKAFFRRGKVEFDGLSDTLKDIACYAVIAEVLRRETDGQTPCG